jgi:hypothetical protein
VTTWFSVPEDQFGAMGGSGRRFSFVGSGYTYEPESGVESLQDVRIPIWSTKCITSRWFSSAPPLVDSDLQSAGKDRVSGTITNRQSVPLEDAILAVGKQVYPLGKIEPGATVRIMPNDRNLSGLLKSKIASSRVNQPGNRDSRIDRADLLLAVMFHDSESAAGGERTFANDPLNGVDLSGQLALERPMLVARINRVGTQLALDNEPSPPKIDQVTLVRLILPVGKPKP